MSIPSQTFPFKKADIAAYCPAIQDMERAKEDMQSWRQNYAHLVEGGPLKDLWQAIETYLEGPGMILDLDFPIFHFWPKDRAAAFVADLAKEAIELRSLFASINRHFREALLWHTPEDLAKLSPSPQMLDMQAYLQKILPLEPQNAMLPWKQLGKATGFDALMRVNTLFLQDQVFGSIDLPEGKVPLNYANYREFYRHKDRDIRESAYRQVQAYIQGVAPILLTIKQARASFLTEGERLASSEDFFKAHCVRMGYSEELISSLNAQLEPSSQLAAQFYTLLTRCLGHDGFRIWDARAPLPKQASVSFAETWDVIANVAAKLSPDYAAIIQELPDAGTVLIDPTAATSPHWYMMSPGKDGSPLVHAPFRGDLESVQALAHELGHACHLTHNYRKFGPGLQLDLPLPFVESFSLLFEVLSMRELTARAASDEERAKWLRAQIEQALHFTRRMLVRAQFDAYYFQNTNASFANLCEQWATLERRSFGGPLDARDSNHSWIFEMFQEELPFYGYGYLLSYLVAMLLADKDVPREQFMAFAERAGFQSLEDSMRTFFAIDLSDPRCFQGIWKHLQTCISELERLTHDTAFKA